MDPIVYWEGIAIRKLSLPDTTLALAIFAQEYVEYDSKQIKDFTPFINNYGL